MKTEAADIKNYQIMFEEKSEFFYSIKPFEITNALGVVVASLDEYFVTNKDENIFKLYKTNEANGFEFQVINAVIMLPF